MKYNPADGLLYGMERGRLMRDGRIVPPTPCAVVRFRHSPIEQLDSLG